jgi:hypothetical protein
MISKESGPRFFNKSKLISFKFIFYFKLKIYKLIRIKKVLLKLLTSSGLQLKQVKKIPHILFFLYILLLISNNSKYF